MLNHRAPADEFCLLGGETSPAFFWPMMEPKSFPTGELPS